MKAEWKPMSSAPRDGSPFLAYVKIVVDEYDKDNFLVIKSEVKYDQVLAHWFLFDFVECPLRSYVSNRTFLAWTELPENPSKEQFS